MSIYYIHAPDLDMVKIGFAQDVESRFGKMKVDSPTRLVILAVEDGDTALEAQRHEQFGGKQGRGEWFAMSDAILDHVAGLAPYSRPKRAPLNGPLGAWMRDNGHTLTTFAELVGTTHASLSRLCAGKQFPRIPVLLKIIEATGGEVDANALLAPWLSK